LYHAETIKGKAIDEIMGDLLLEFLGALDIGKTMRWGSYHFEFARPVRSLLVMHGSEVINCEIFGVRSANSTFVHRMYSFEKQAIGDIDNFEDFLSKKGVILSAQKRREKILSDFAQIEQENPHLMIDRDESLLNEIVALTEYPNAIIGKFDESFLELPQEVIIVSMKSNQRYFPIFANGRLTNRFVVVSNAFCENFSEVIRGNEKVLRPRLSDALFFWRNDLNNALPDEPLKHITYAHGLGTIYDKQKRECEIVKRLQTLLEITDQHIDRATALSKLDLASQMVYEFTELQGIMGMHYARKLGENEAVATAIGEQYLPIGEDSALPTTQTGALLAVATKIDSLMALFSIRHIPSGSKDPLGLRRAASGIIRIAIDRRWHLKISQLIAAIADLYAPFDQGRLATFFKERLFSLLPANISIIKAVLATNEDDLSVIKEKVEALANVSASADFKANFALFKRVANILKDQDLLAFGAVDRSLFETVEESALFDAFVGIQQGGDPTRQLEALFGLKETLGAFFDAVMVNAENARIRGNRLALLAGIYSAFLQVADIKEISF
jgi:glycyl-tRNA synthetase beta chain